ncbi:MAG: family 20 glycosylhydrolase, partial [Sedimentisphaerales bacterium]|nr:family 20 glycosylhydrolase [Sedimentisphaerales bacterium]
MKARTITGCIFLLALLSGHWSWLHAGIDIIPCPSQVQVGDGCFSVASDTAILVCGPCQEQGRYFADMLRSASGYELAVTAADMDQAAANRIMLHLDSSRSDIGREAYHLLVDSKGVMLTASTNAGLFYGLQTLRQLLPPEIESDKPIAGIKLDIPYITIADSPRFAWRGLHLDVSRHIFPVEFIKKYIDLMARYKLNTFHWHLTDDQGWR